MIAIQIQSLSKTYKGKKGRAVEALSDLSLSIEQGEVFGFLGPNGAGKSTTIKLLMGLIAPSSGSALVCGIPVINPASRSKIGYLPENPSFYDFLSGREYLAFVGAAFGMSRESIHDASDEVLRTLDLTEAADRPIRGYSKGMVQRLGLAQTLLHRPDIYILDEPMSGLDPIGRALVKEIIRDLKRQGKTVFFSTHITSDIEAVCDRVGVIVSGKLRVADSVENVLERGVEGYDVRLHVGPNLDDSLTGFQVVARAGSMVDVFVPRDRFRSFMEMMIKVEAEVDLIETKRRDLESFFLEIVNREVE